MHSPGEGTLVVGETFMPKEDPDQSGKKEEVEQRLKRVLQGAFSGPPTPLKDIPTRWGESRKLKSKKPQRRRLRRQRKNRAA
jgi:hypothetical protein